VTGCPIEDARSQSQRGAKPASVSWRCSMQIADHMTSPSARPSQVVLTLGAGGCELVTRLGDTLGRRGVADVTLIDKSRTDLWKPLLHEVAAGAWILRCKRWNSGFKPIGTTSASYRATCETVLTALSAGMSDSNAGGGA